MLVVDDDPTIRRLVAGLLADEGYDAQPTLDGEHALRSATALHPDLIILDVHVPDKALAVRFAEIYRDRVPPGSRAPIIVLSGASDLQEIAQRLGASAFLEKPFDVNELLHIVARFLPEPAADGAEATPSVWIEPGAWPAWRRRRAANGDALRPSSIARFSRTDKRDKLGQ